jgi:hypothetical protein
MVLGGDAIGGRRVRRLASFPNKYPGAIHKKAGEMDGKAFQRGDTSATFPCGSLAPHPSHALEVTEDLD